jgi:hypothetical protein
VVDDGIAEHPVESGHHALVVEELAPAVEAPDIECVR